MQGETPRATPRVRAGARLAWLAALPPAVFTALLIAQNGIDTLFMDDWALVGHTLVRAGSGDLGVAELFGQHNESRPFFPRLLFLGVGLLARGDTRWLLGVTFSLACLVALSVFLLARSTWPARAGPLWVPTFLASFLIFTPKQAGTWLWPSFVGLEPIACLTACLALLHSGWSPGRKVALGAALCTIATFSYANGLSTWLLAAPVLVLTVGPRWLGGWTLGFLLNAALYFHGYVTPAGHPALLDGAQPVRLAHYVLAFLGAPLGLNRPAVATAVGAAFVILFALAGGYLLRHARDETLRRRMTPWLCIGGYALSSGLAAGVGRSPVGVRQALVNRYVPFSLYLGLSLLFLVPIALEHAGARQLLRPKALRSVQALLAVCLATGVTLGALSAAMGVGEMIREGRLLLYGKTCLLFINVHPDEACLTSRVFPSTKTLRWWANGLDRQGYLHPPLVGAGRLQDLRPRGPVLREVGVFESLLNRPGRFVATGWAGLPTKARPADAVILAREASDGDWVPLAFAPVVDPGPDTAHLREGASRTAGWRKGLIKRELPSRPFRVSAWAFDARTAWALPLEGVHVAEAGDRVRRIGRGGDPPPTAEGPP